MNKFDVMYFFKESHFRGARWGRRWLGQPTWGSRAAGETIVHFSKKNNLIQIYSFRSS